MTCYEVRTSIKHNPIDLGADKWGPSRLKIKMKGDRELLMRVEKLVLHLEQMDLKVTP